MIGATAWSSRFRVLQGRPHSKRFNN